MADTLQIDRGRTAVLIMDYQNEIVSNFAAQQPGLLARAATVLAAAREAGLPVIYVVVRFRPGYPEVSPRNKLFGGIREAGRLQEGAEGAEIHPQVAPQAGDVVVTKRRVGAFATTDLETILRARDVSTLLLFGIATSGVVLSTVRWCRRRRLRDGGRRRLLRRRRRRGAPGTDREGLPAHGGGRGCRGRDRGPAPVLSRSKGLS